MSQLSSEIEIDCPCCSSPLVVALHLRRVVSHREPEREDEAALREAMFNQSVADEKGRSDALAKRFEAALKNASTEPVTKPVRDFDLD